MRTFTRRVAAIVLIVLVLIGVAAPGRALAGGSVGPRQMLIDYYNNINSRRFDLAYGQWTSPPQTYANFAAGYADTSFVSAYFGGFQPGYTTGVQGRVPGVLIGYHTDGSAAAYSGCYDLQYVPGTTGVAQWRITGADFQPLGTIPYGDTITQALDRWCYGGTTANGVYTSPQAMLVDYFSAVNLGDYPAAYALWTQPRQTYANFVAGWATTSETVMFYGAYQYGGGYNAPEFGRVPVVLLGYHTDGSLAAYRGCIGVAYSGYTTARWGLWNAYLTTLPTTTTPDAASITAALTASCYTGV